MSIAVTFGMLAGCGSGDDPTEVAAEPVDATMGAGQPGPDLGPDDLGRSDLLPADLGHPDQGSADIGLGDVVPKDSSTADLGDPDLGPSDAGPSDSGLFEVGPIDLGSPDSGFADTGGLDAGLSDRGDPDLGPSDAGPSDSGLFEVGPIDLGSPDSGFADTGGLDAGLSDRGMDTGVSDGGLSCMFGGDYSRSNTTQWYRFDRSGNWTVASSRAALGTNPNLGTWSVGGRRFTIQDTMTNCGPAVVGSYDLSYGAACEVTMTLVSDACSSRATVLTAGTFLP